MKIEWPTLALLTLCYAVWALAITWLANWSVSAAILLAGLAAALHSSLSHEALHGHPTRFPMVNALLVGLPLTLIVPYLRFKDTHLAHHQNECLTDPYDDPETNYQALPDWSARPAWQKAIYRLNNTLAGRLLLGPWLGQWAFMRADLILIRKGDRRALLGWLLHLPALALVLGFLVLYSPLPVWAHVLWLWLALAILKIRTFLEHQAHEHAGGRTVIIEDRGPLALIFLNNNLHAVHHAKPAVPWYQLPTLYAANRAKFLARNQTYLYRSYAQVFRRHFLWRKDEVPHPFWRRGE